MACPEMQPSLLQFTAGEVLCLFFQVDKSFEINH